MLVDKQILWFEVPIHDPTLMKVTDGLHYLADVKFGLRFRKGLFYLKVVKKLTPCAQFHHEEQFFGSLEGPVQLDHIFVVQLQHNITFLLDSIPFLAHVLLAQNFDCVQHAGVLFASECHTRKTTTADNLQKLE